jgi:predicted dehydrogenase
MNRREFVGRAAGTLGALSIANPSLAEASSSEPINLGIIGPGSRGQQLLRTFLRVPGLKIKGLCDVYEPRFAAARKITGESTPIYRDFRALLDDKKLDAIIVATPLSLHAEHVVAALESGKHVYGEKSLALDIAGCDRILEAVKHSGKHFQVGLQYTYAPWYRETIRQIQAGKLGRITQIYAYWHRNNSWRRPVPDPKDAKLERLINWRLYKEYSGGLLAELGSHHIGFANEIFAAMPSSVIGTGGIDYWKDGREVDDNIQLTYRYLTGQSLVFSSITTNRFDGCQIQVLGTQGTAVLTESDAFIYYEPTAHPATSPAVVLERGVATGASYRSELPYRGQGTRVEIPTDKAGNADYVACSSFIECLRNSRKPLADERVAWAEGVSVALGNLALQEGKRIVFAEHLHRSATAG